MASHRETTRRSTARWQVAAVVLAGVTAGVLALPLDGLLSPSLAKNKGLGDGASIEDPAAKPAQLTDVSTASVSMRLLGGPRVEPVKKPDPVSVAGNTDEPTPGTTPPPPGPTNERSQWAYLGSIVGPRSTNALVRVSGKQHIIAEGGEVGAVKLVSVGGDHIVVREGEDEGRVELQKPTGLIMTSTSPALPMPMGGANLPMDARRAALARNVHQDANGGVQLNDQQMQLLRKAMGNPAVSERERMRVLEQSGFPASMPPLERARKFKELHLPASADPFIARAMAQYGIDPASDNNDIIRSLEEVYGDMPDGGF